MRGVGLAAAGSLLLLVAGLAWQPLDGSADTWQSPRGGGHLALAQHLAQRADVRVIEASWALLPAGAGAGDALVLFPTHRLPTSAEGDALQAFARAGGTVLVATDGGHANAWLGKLGGGVHGLPVLLPAGAPTGVCLPALFHDAGQQLPVCLPSPSVLGDRRNATPEADAGAAQVLGQLVDPVGLDLDEDGELGLVDQAPANYPVGVGWPVGAGRVVVIADSQVWTNEVVREHPENLALAGVLASQAKTIFLDGTGASASLPQAASSGVAAGAADPASGKGLSLLLGLAAFVAALALQKRHGPWRPHVQDLGKVPQRILTEARSSLHSSLRQPAGSPPADAGVQPSGDP